MPLLIMNKNIQVELWQFILACAVFIFTVGGAVGAVHSSIAVLTEKVSSLTHTVALMSDKQQTQWEAWAKHETAIQVTNKRLDTVENKLP